MNAHHAFEHLRSQEIPALNLTLEEYEHSKTGAKHYHLSADNSENVFMVAVRTVPEDSTGVAHILEHTALCGSEKYPVRDPFFMMIRRSLNTFMNAFTSSDWTAYPFASQNRKDFDNLLQVYLDAVFFSRLDELDFAQEGHRVEFEQADNPDSDLVYKGVVFNEMKGAMSSISSQLWQTLSKYLFPTTTYHYNSGGDPEDIPDLSYEDLLAFYKTHYHPSNAMFLTYGDITAVEHQQKFESLALDRFERLEKQIAVGDERRFEQPQRVVEHYPTDDADVENKSHMVMAWLLGNSTNLQDLLEAQLLANVLLDNSSSPLLQLLETTELGSAPSPMCGMEDSNRELVFCCGIEGAAKEAADDFEALILDKLRYIAEHGVEHERLESVLHQLEFHQREIGGDGYPYGLQIIMAALGPATHRGDPVAALDIEPVLEQLREQIADPDFIKQLTKKLLLENKHRLTLVMHPDPELGKLRNDSEAARLAEMKAQMSDEDRSAVVELASQLQARQERVDDADILPKVELSDVPAGIQVHPSTESVVGKGSMPLTFFPQGTNGIVYQQLIVPMPAFSAAQLQLLPLFTSFMSELGIGDMDYLQTQALQAAHCGSLGAYSSVRPLPGNEQDHRAFIVLSGKSLSRKSSELSDLMMATFKDVRFDESTRIQELIAQMSARREQSITGNGHSLAMSAACSGMSPVARVSYLSSGLHGIRWLKGINKDLDVGALQAELESMHSMLSAQSRQMLLVAEQDQYSNLAAGLDTALASLPGSGNNDTGLQLDSVRTQQLLAWQTNTQVNFCAKAYPTVSTDHEDAAALTVLGGFLRNGYLHRSIREQGGAYGGGASHDSANANFRFYSYRDPRLTETMDDFDQSIRWLLDTNHEWQSVEEAILGVVSSLDKPGSPAGEAKQQFHSTLSGRTPEQREQFRSRVLNVTAADLKRVGEQWLGDASKASVAVVSSAETLTEQKPWLDANGLSLEVL
ncbi:MAG: insulinase family protein [Pseudomonadales bacterium]